MGLVILALVLATFRIMWGLVTGRSLAPMARLLRIDRAAPDFVPGPIDVRGYALSPPAPPAPSPARDCDVLVVGAGPTGLMLANLLTRSGVKVRIVDMRREPSSESRAFAVQARSVELFQSIGLADELLARSIVNTGIDFHVAGERIGGLDFDRAHAPDTPFQFITMIPQADSEALLIEDLARLGVHVERGVRVETVSQTADGVIARGLSSSHQDIELRSAYLVGADGAHSIVRKQLGLKFEGAKYAQSFLLADCQVDWGLDHGRFRVFMNREVIGLFLPLKGRRISRVMATDPRPAADEHGGPGRSALPMDLAELQEAFSQAAQVPVTLSNPVWTARYRVHHRGVDRYRAGRAFVAGDAAHIHSPAGGQGMNTGLQDAANLAWKLAAVIRHGAQDALLDSYHAERFPVGQDVLRFTDRLFSAAAAQTGWRAWMRDRVASFVVRRASLLPIPHRKAFRKLSEISIAYPRGPFVEEPGRRAPRGGPRAGARAPDAVISHGLQVFDLLRGYRLQLLVLSRTALNEQQITDISEQLRSVTSAWPALGVHVVARVAGRSDPRVTFVDSAEVFDRYGVDTHCPQALYLVRPDGYVAWRCAGLDVHACVDFVHRLHGHARSTVS